MGCFDNSSNMRLAYAYFVGYIGIFELIILLQESQNFLSSLSAIP